MTGRRGRRRRKLLDDLKERRGYFHLKEEALDRTMWRARFGRGFGPVVRQTAKRNERVLLPCCVSAVLLILLAYGGVARRIRLQRKMLPCVWEVMLDRPSQE